MAILTPDLMGGLGNQLFQICSSYGIAKELDFELKLPDKTLDPGKWKYYGYLFDLPKVNINSIEYNHYLHEKNLQDIRPELSKLSGNVRIHAYLQKYTYFKNCLDDLFQQLHKPSFFHLFPEVNLACHFRKGDYLYLSDYHNNLTEEYYKRAFSKIKKEGKFDYIEFFSDDRHYISVFCNNNKKTIKKHAYTWLSRSSSNEINDFFYMTNAEYLITANSTFSLMASFLGSHKQVIVPDESIWFGPKNKHLDTTGMIPENYIRIKTN